MSRHTTSREFKRPAGFIAILAATPACFEPPVWKLYVEEVWRSSVHAPAPRRRMRNGEPPDYCGECLVEYRAKMLAAGRCHPPPGAQFGESAEATP